MTKWKTRIAVRPRFKKVLFVFAMAGTMVGLHATAATALTAALAKACEAAAYQAFPNQHIGSKVGVEQRAKFRLDCIAKNGPDPKNGPDAKNGPDSATAAKASPPPASASDKAR
jgi:hypothetical protein